MCCEANPDGQVAHCCAGEVCTALLEVLQAATLACSLFTDRRQRGRSPRTGLSRQLLGVLSLCVPHLLNLCIHLVQGGYRMRDKRAAAQHTLMSAAAVHPMAQLAAVPEGVTLLCRRVTSQYREVQLHNSRLTGRLPVCRRMHMHSNGKLLCEE
jgi:hypothetical protein